ncbi:MAG: F0F1 ATP synthase subunit B [Bacteroidales bacterium]|nr:F0F1 ATP synthase subunit B [Bacteroidales bacterium]
MSLLIPDSGLLFWMIISFGVVFFILAKFGFPVIVRMVEERRKNIQKSLDNAKLAEDQLKNFKAESESIINLAREEQVKILHEANQLKENILNSAKQEAKELTAKQIEQVKKEIQKEKEAAIQNIKSQIAILSVEVAEKVLRQELNNSSAQMNMINKLVEETANMKS